jgi:HSP20 family protein
MKLARWEPFKEAEDFFRQFGAPMFGRWPSVGGKGSEVSEWAPVADISETDKEYVVKAEIPGVKPGDIKVSLDNGILTIEGERKYEKEDKSEKTHRVESFFGSFCRRFALPDDANTGGIRAEGKDGVLKVHVPKAASAPPAAPKQIKVE